MNNTVKNSVFGPHCQYTQAALALASEMRPEITKLVNKLLTEGYTLRTVIASVSQVPAEVVIPDGVDPVEFKAIWIGEVFDLTLDRLLGLGV